MTLPRNFKLSSLPLHPPLSRPPLSLIPTLDDEVKRASVGGVYEVKEPAQYKSTMPYPYPYSQPTSQSDGNGNGNGNGNGSEQDENREIETIQFRCQSLFTKSPDTIHCCNQTIKTIIGRGSGEQTEIISCGKCRTSYLIKTTYHDGEKEPTIKAAVWEINRNIKNYCKVKRDSEQRVWLEFNSEK